MELILKEPAHDYDRYKHDRLMCEFSRLSTPLQVLYVELRTGNGQKNTATVLKRCGMEVTMLTMFLARLRDIGLIEFRWIENFRWFRYKLPLEKNQNNDN